MEGDITSWLRAARQGDAAAAARVAETVSAELRIIAASVLRRERPGHTLQPTALVNEAWLRLAGESGTDYANRVHFFASAAKVMRRALVDHARANAADKRGGGWTRVTVAEGAGQVAAFDVDVLALHAALEKLQALSERQARVVELRWFGGLTQAETAEVLGVSATTVENDWAFARAWLRRELDG